MTDTISILIAEDESIIAAHLSATLQRLGYNVLAMVSTGEEAMQAAHTLRPHLVLMDIGLAGALDGINAAEQIRAQTRIPVVFLTAHADPDTLARAKVAEPFGFLVKPFQDASLQATIETALYKHEADQQLWASEMRYHIVADNTTDWEYWILPDGQFEYNSPSCEWMTGYPPAAFKANPKLFTRIIYPDDVGAYDQHLREVRATHREGRVEFRIVRADGEVRWLDHICRPVQNAEGQYWGRRGSNRDITERKEAEKAVQYQSDLLRGVAETANLLLTNTAERATLSVALETLGRVFHADRAYLFRDVCDTESGEWFATQIYKWARAGVDTQSDNPEPQRLPFASGFARWPLVLTMGGVIKGAVSQLPLAEREALQKQDIQSIINAPIFVRGQYWGRLGLDDCHAPRQWTEVEEASLKLAAASLSGALERQEAEEALRDERGLFIGGPTIVFKWQAVSGWPVLYVSPNLREQFGHAPEDLLSGKIPYASLIHPEDLERVAEEVTTYTQSDARYFEQEYRLKRADGEYRWTRDFTKIDRDAEGRATHYHGYVSDITDRKHAEAALLESEERFRRLADHAPDIIFRYNFVPALGLVYINPAVQAITGYTPAECYADPYLMLNMAHAEDAGRMGDYLQSHTIPDEPLFMRWIGKDGVVRWMESRIVPVNDATGNLIAVEGITRDISARKRAEDALRESEASYRGLFNSIPDAIYIQDEQGRFLEVNEGAVQMYGRAREWLVGRTPGDVAAPDKNDIPAVLAQVAAAFAGQPQQFEFWGQRANGEIFPKDVRLFPGRYKGQKVLIAIARDITDNKRAEAELQAERDFALSVMNAMGQGLTVTDGDSRFEYINPAYARFMGFMPSELIGRSPGDVTYEPDQQVLEEQSRRRKQGETTAYETRLVKKDGSLVDVLITGTPRRRGGQIEGSIAVITDLTERKRAERAMAEEQGRLRALIQASRDGLTLIGVDERLHIVNQPVLELVGLPGRAEEWLGRSFTEFIAAISGVTPIAPSILAERRRIQRGDEPPAEGEWMMPTRTVHWYNLPVLTEQRVLGRLVILRDVTQERQVEQMREDLTRTMVHDLRNPLTSLRGAMQVFALDGVEALTPDQLDMLHVMDETINTMHELVTAILDVSRLESGKMPLERETFPLATVLDETIHQQAPLAAQHGVRLIFDQPHVAPIVCADPQLVQRVIQNLVGNALKFTPEGGEVRVSAEPYEGTVLVRVSDTGPGIAPGLQSQLFQKFVTGRVQKRGSGLGLAFCRLVVEAHGGRIWVESTPGRGATFQFTLPLQVQ